ncbi:MAG TPA: hypothetical protein VK934_03415, partial [Fimbriimonas sp.]|nr:hypothetical protein [Fimbriimonas sp.]
MGLLLLTGCGGGGQGPSDGGTGGEPPPAAPEGTARLIVNTQTGAVQVVPLTPSSRAVFAGQAIKIASNLLLDAPGSTGRRVLNVALQNNSGEPVGVGNDGSVSGLKVVFTSFTNLNPGGNLRELTQVSTVAGTGPGFLDGPSSNAKLNGVTGIAIAQDGTTYLADGLNHRIRKISNGYVSTLAGSGTASSVDGYGVNASFNKPYDIALGPDGSLYVSEVTGNKIRRVTADGRVTTVCGTGVAGYTNGAGNVAQFSKPEGIAIGPDGGIYVCDSNNRRLRKIEFLGGDATLSTNYSALTFAGSGVDSSVDGTSNTASFRSPRDVACDPSGNLFVTDRLGSRIRYVTRDGDVVTICGTSVAGSTDGPGNTARCNFPSGITQLNDGTSNTILFTETGNNSLRQATLQPGTSPGVASNWTVRWVACNGTAGYVDGRGDSAMFSAPAGPAYWNGSLYVADGGNSAVRQVSCSQGFPVPYDSGPATSELPSLADADGVTAKQEPYLLYEGSLASGA